MKINLRIAPLLALLAMGGTGCLPDTIPESELPYDDSSGGGDTDDAPTDTASVKDVPDTTVEKDTKPASACTDATVAENCVHSGPCELPKCSAAGTCVYVAKGVKGAACDDGMVCNGEADQCDGKGACVGTVDPNEACTGNSSECAVGKCNSDGSCKLDVGGQVDLPCVLRDAQGKKIGCVTNSTCQADGTCGGGIMLCPCIPPNLIFDGPPADGKKKDTFWWQVKGVNDEAIDNFLCAPFVSASDACLGRQYCDATTSNNWSCKVLPNTNKYKDKCTESANTCIENNCNTKTGKCEQVLAPDTKSCNDKDACTTNDFCDGKGACQGQVSICKCTPLNAQTKCAYLKGDNACEGVFCNTKAGAPNFECELNPSAKVNCSTNNDTACTENLCNKKTGQCNLTPVNEGKFVCDDGNECLVNEGCFGGICGPKPGEKQTNLCKCTKDADCASEENGDTCDGLMFCKKDEAGKGECVENQSTVVTCPSVNDTLCVRNFCYPSTGQCKMTPTENIKKEIFITDPKKNKQVPYPYRIYDFISCDDGNVCTANDECDKGVCKVGKTSLCVCKQDNDCIDDGDFCNGTLYCDLSSGSGECKTNPATVVTCSSLTDTQCAKNECDKKTGTCALKPLNKDGVILINQACTDGRPCTDGDYCKDGQCVSGTDICLCTKDTDCAKYESGDKCEGTYFCAKAIGQCKLNLKDKVICNKSNDTQCLANRCDAKTGVCSLKPIKQFEKCDDGDPCSASPVCVNGQCFSDVNLCQCALGSNDCDKFGSKTDKCVPQYKCVGPAPFQCKPVDKPKCIGESDSEACFTFGCDKATGDCVQKPKSAFNSCDDDNPCTVGDTCDGSIGECNPGTNLCLCGSDADCEAFDDGNPCNGTTFCDKSIAGKSKCVLKPGTKVDCSANQPDATACYINGCNPDSGKCEKSTKAGACPDDGDPCTLERCGASNKCETLPAKDGTNVGTDPATGNPLYCMAGKKVVGPKGMTLVPAGGFFMGCSESPDAGSSVFQAAADSEGKECKTASDEKPQHQVTLDSYWIGLHEVTVKQYKACVDAGKCKAPDKDLGECIYNRWQARVLDPNFKPVEKEIQSRAAVTCVDHSNAIAYCAWAADKDLVTKAGAGTLPTEAQWEYAARGSCDTVTGKECGKRLAPYTWGFKPYPADCDSAWVKSISLPCSVTETQAIGGRDSDTSVYGLQDLVGNAREWVRDGYNDAFYASGDATKKNPEFKLVDNAVVRGGSFALDGKFGRLTNRSTVPANNAATPDLGFRCARPVK